MLYNFLKIKLSNFVKMNVIKNFRVNEMEKKIKTFDIPKML